MSAQPGNGRQVHAPTQLQLLLVIAFGGILGSLARWAVALGVGERQPGHLPWGTLIVNIVGCLAIGIIATRLPTDHGRWWLRPLLITGVLGGFTTFSAYAVETGELIDEGAVAYAAGYLVVTVIAGLLAVRAGQFIAGRNRRT